MENKDETGGGDHKRSLPQHRSAVPRIARKSPHLPTKWPKIGGEDLVVSPTNVFLSEEYSELFRPSGERRLIYAGGSPGAATLARAVAVPLYKISTTGADRLADRFWEINRDAWGAWVRDDDDEWTRDPGYTRWFPSHLYPSLAPSPNSPVTIGSRALTVDLPEGLTAQAFDEAFDASVRLGAADVWSMTPERRRHCEARGVSPGLLRRFTSYPGWRRSPCVELCGFSIYSGADRLVALSEQIVVKHLGLTWTPFDD